MPEQYGKTMQEERALLGAAGYESDYILRLQPKRPWLRADGTLVGVLPVDAYHYKRFSDRGWKPAPPDYTLPVQLETPALPVLIKGD
jgi:hypothetical protein